MSRCGNIFRGGCDIETARYIQNLIESESLLFIHWTTLNTHFPIAASDAIEFDGICKANKYYENCIYQELSSKILTSIIDIASSKAIRSTKFIIVGDHPPRFISPDTKGLYNPETVPFIVLSPKN
jgi:hypothetical protein